MAENSGSGLMTGLMVLGGVVLGAGIAYLILKKRQQAEQHTLYYDPPVIKHYKNDEPAGYYIMGTEAHDMPAIPAPQAPEIHYKNDEETLFKRNSEGFIESFKVIRDARQAASVSG